MRGREGEREAWKERERERVRENIVVRGWRGGKREDVGGEEKRGVKMKALMIYEMGREIRGRQGGWVREKVI